MIVTASVDCTLRTIRGFLDYAFAFGAIRAITVIGAQARPEPQPKIMQVLQLQIAIGIGKDKQVNPLFDGPRRKLVQITLRNKAILDAHKASVPITIQCIAGYGSLTSEDAVETLELMPGVLVTIEPNVSHEIKANPAVSILLTQFTDKMA